MVTALVTPSLETAAFSAYQSAHQLVRTVGKGRLCCYGGVTAAAVTCLQTSGFSGNRRLGNRLQRRDSVDTSLDTCALRMGGGDVSGLAFRLLIQGGNISTLICFSVAAMPSI